MAWQFSSGDILTAANLNAVTRPWNALCQVSQSSTQSLTNNTATDITFDTEDLDPLGWHSVVSLTNRIVPTIAGWYRATGVANFGSDGDYVRISIDLLKNSLAATPRIGMTSFVPGTATLGPVLSTQSVLTSLNGSTDYVELQCLQNNTSAAANTVQCRLLLELVYPT